MKYSISEIGRLASTGSLRILGTHHGFLRSMQRDVTMERITDLVKKEKIYGIPYQESNKYLFILEHDELEDAYFIMTPQNTFLKVITVFTKDIWARIRL